ncbi:Phox homologous domain-containing protein [Gorgonomyces haynaldii]|nr:Phox homologous domain-containing protein [Gorgonomyces haynaldii]
MNPIEWIEIIDTETRTDTKRHTVYVISVKGQVRKWTITKRYSEFEQLDKLLQTVSSIPSPLPPKLLFPDQRKLEERRQGLQEYLQKILFSKSKICTSSYWYDFLDVPEKLRQEGFRFTKKQESDFDPEQWLKEYSDLKSFLVQIRSCVHLRDQHQSNTSQYQSAKLEARKGVSIAQDRISNLESSLQENQTYQRQNSQFSISMSEINRRKDLLVSLKSELEQLKKETDKITQPTPDRAQLLGTPLKSGRKFGVAQETQETRQLDNGGLVQLQQRQMQDQDRALEQLSQIVSRQKEIGIAIGQELDSQNKLLDMLDEDVTQTSGNLKTSDNKLKRLLK